MGPFAFRSLSHHPASSLLRLRGAAGLLQFHISHARPRSSPRLRRPWRSFRPLGGVALGNLPASSFRFVLTAPGEFSPPAWRGLRNPRAPESGTAV